MRLKEVRSSSTVATITHDSFHTVSHNFNWLPNVFGQHRAHLTMESGQDWNQLTNSVDLRLVYPYRGLRIQKSSNKHTYVASSTLSYNLKMSHHIVNETVQHYLSVIRQPSCATSLTARQITDKTFCKVFVRVIKIFLTNINSVNF